MKQQDDWFCAACLALMAGWLLYAVYNLLVWR